MTYAMNLRVVWALAVRATNEVLRVAGGAIPGILAPTIFMIGISGVFGEAANLPGFEAHDFRTFVVPVGMLQGAGFTGAATGVNLARDIEGGWFDRLMLAPVPRPVILAGVLASAALRALMPATFLFVTALALGVEFPGVLPLGLAYALTMAFATAAACWGVIVALRFRTQQAAPLMQVVVFASVLFTTAYAPVALLSPWLRTVADVNPTRYVLDGVRQSFVGGVDAATTLYAVLAVLGLLAVLGTFAVRGMQRVGR